MEPTVNKRPQCVFCKPLHKTYNEYCVAQSQVLSSQRHFSQTPTPSLSNGYLLYIFTSLLNTRGKLNKRNVCSIKNKNKLAIRRKSDGLHWHTESLPVHLIVLQKDSIQELCDLDLTLEFFSPVFMMQGVQGFPGMKGDDGLPGDRGEDVSSCYTTTYFSFLMYFYFTMWSCFVLD